MHLKRELPNFKALDCHQWAKLVERSVAICAEGSSKTVISGRNGKMVSNLPLQPAYGNGLAPKAKSFLQKGKAKCPASLAHLWFANWPFLENVSTPWYLGLINLLSQSMVGRSSRFSIGLAGARRPSRVLGRCMGKVGGKSYDCAGGGHASQKLALGISLIRTGLRLECLVQKRANQLKLDR